MKIVQQYLLYTPDHCTSVNYNVRKLPKPEATVYDNIRDRLGHDTEGSAITLLIDMVDIEKHACQSRLPNMSNPI